MNQNNLHILHGFVGKEPVIRRTEKSIVASFSFATDASYKDGDGKKVEKTEWHNIVAWGPTATLIEKYVKVGSELNLYGEVMTSPYEDKAGIKKYITETRISSLVFCGTKKDKLAETPQAANDSPPEVQDDLPF